MTPAALRPSPPAIAPGARVEIRDAEWIVRRVDRASHGGQLLRVVGVSELVRGHEASFLTELEPDLRVLDPAETDLVADGSPRYRDARLYLESLRRQTPPTGAALALGHRAAMDVVPYQLKPALQALAQPRQRILIADGVGLGKTLEAGILLAELIRRGRGKRILVVTLKSMLTQFQKELWSRFTIPLTRLDSAGLQRVRAQIPADHNPFFHFDKAIISIDTLKQAAEYRTYIEEAYWDVIVVDEAHNVADRGTRSLRNRVASLLARRSDSLILLSATPHDGRPESFASLMNMLDPTAIADPSDYTRDDIEGLFVRRFKHDVQDEVREAFQERHVEVLWSDATPAEEAAFETLAGLRLERLDGSRGGAHLFTTTLTKALFSSPAACLETVQNRIRTIRTQTAAAAGGDAAGGDAALDDDIAQLQGLAADLEQIEPAGVSKYQRLLALLRDPDYGWTPTDPADRLVIFTERVRTLRFLEEHLRADLGLKKEQVETLHGSMGDLDIQRIVEDFGKSEAPVRVLIASDVASEGINLHYLSHRLVHFDVPWSLMVFQQRNGRVDRYGQTRAPLIRYLLTRSAHPEVSGDARILEVLVRKDEQAHHNIGDPLELLGVYDAEKEEAIVADVMESGETAEAFEARLDDPAARQADVMALLLGEAAPDMHVPISVEHATHDAPSLFADDAAYLEAALASISERTPLQHAADRARGLVELTAPDELRHRLRRLPREVRPEHDHFVLSTDREAVQREIERCRQDERAWPGIHYLWDLHPVVEWAGDKVVAAFGRQQAPVLHLASLQPGETVVLFSGLVPNRRSHPLVNPWFGVRFLDGALQPGVEPFADLLARTGLDAGGPPNPGLPVDAEALRALLLPAVGAARAHMRAARDAFEAEINPRLSEHLDRLDRLLEKQVGQLDLDFVQDGRLGAAGRRDERRRQVDQIFDDYYAWIKESMTTEPEAYLQVLAVLTAP